MAELVRAVKAAEAGSLTAADAAATGEAGAATAVGAETAADAGSEMIAAFQADPLGATLQAT